MKIARAFLDRALAAAEGAPPRVAALIAELATRVSLAENEDAGTARIRGTSRRATLEIAPSFVMNNLICDEDALYVLLHEVLHKARGDLGDPHGDIPAPVLNIAMDIRVNEHLARLCFPESPPLVRRMYAGAPMPGILLLPPWDLARHEAAANVEWQRFGRTRTSMIATLASDPSERPRLTEWAARAMRRAGAVDPRRAARVYLNGWLDDVMTHAFAQDVAELLRDEGCDDTEVWLLGDHEGSGDDILRDVLQGLRVAGEGGELEEDELVEIVHRECREFCAAVRRAVVASLGTEVDRLGLAVDRGVVGHLGRREALLLAGGVWPTFFPCAGVAPTPIEEQLHVYLDVSGSTSFVQPLMYGLALALGPLLGRRVFEFSTEVVEASVSELARGVRRTTGGTDFDVVLEHALERRFPRILVVTDGIGTVSDEVAERVKKRRMETFVVITEPAGENGFRDVSAGTWFLPDSLLGKERGGGRFV